ncbi:MAG: uracil-DNA glycosylase [Eubacteriales bacterium]|nr:uracil-DNA glycosylase [Eubacteriales bacterium]MDD4540677.1 uracil-DNA glycosylase [Eubacteriales bacterium]
MSTEENRKITPAWQGFIDNCLACQDCELAQSRQNVVIWRGSIDAPLMIVGEGPGANEDAQGLPFVGRSGELLDTLLQSFELTEDDYHICNIVKCRPPDNRNPREEEARACRRLLSAQIRLVRPKVFLLMGAVAYRYFTSGTEGISKVRGQWIVSNDYFVMPTYHPAYILRDNRRRPELWQDVFAVRQKLTELGLKEPLSQD